MPATLDRQGLTSVLAPLVAPATVRFKDVHTGQWITGISEPKVDPNHFRISLDVLAYAPCEYRAYPQEHAVLRQMMLKTFSPQVTPDGSRCEVCGLPRELIGERRGPANLLTNVFAKFVQAGILGQTTTINDTANTPQSVTNALNGGINQRTGHAGTGVTPATVADINLQTTTENTTSVTINAVSGAGAVGTFTVTYTVTATANRAYTEVGIIIRTTTNSWNFLITHDSFAALNVSNAGTLAVTYTFTNQ